MKFLMMILVVLFACSCSTVQPVACSVESAVTGALSAGIAKGLACSNPAQIQADIQTALGKANFCSMTTSFRSNYGGAVGDFVCPFAVSTVLGLISSKIPSTWGCSPTASASGLSTVLTAACEQVVPI